VLLPLVHDRLTARLGWAFLEAGEWALAQAGGLSTPLLLMHGTGDAITSHQASVEFARRAGDACTLRLWEGLFHELHNEPQWRDVVAEIIAWMEERLPEI
jgi:alpha-beta hydrolase superfamily lysophospholipase